MSQFAFFLSCVVIRCCVELSQQASSWIEDPQLATRIMNFSIAFAYTVKQCLRREQLHAEDLHGIVDPAEVKGYFSYSTTVYMQDGLNLRCIVVCRRRKHNPRIFHAVCVSIFGGRGRGCKPHALSTGVLELSCVLLAPVAGLTWSRS